MASDYIFQLNVKIGTGYDAHLLNIVGVSPEEFQTNLQWVTQNAAGIVSTITALEAVNKVNVLAPNVVSTQVHNEAPGQWADRPYAQATPQAYTPPQQTQQQYQQAAVQQAPPQQQQGPSPSCAHGPMKLVPGGISKGSGKAYNAFYSCTAGRDSGCKSVNG